MVRKNRAVVFAITVITALLMGSASIAAPPDPWSNSLPGYDPATFSRFVGPPEPFSYPSAFRLLEFAGEQPPGEDVLEEIEPFFLKDGKTKRYEFGTLQYMLAKWRDVEKNRRGGPRGWKEFVEAYVKGVDSNKVGDPGFEDFVGKKLNQYRAGYTSPTEKLQGSPVGVIPDHVPPKLGVGDPIVEDKHTMGKSQRSQSQLNDYIQIVDTFNNPVVVAFPALPPKAWRDAVDAANKATAVNKARAAAGQPLVNAISPRFFPAIAVKTPLPDPYADRMLAELAAKRGGTAPSKVDGEIALGNQHAVNGTVSDVVTDSPASAAEAAVEQEMLDEMADEVGDPEIADAGSEELGGVDFSTLELRYIADTYDGGVGTGVQYAYKVDPKPGEQASFGGRQAAQLAADAFFTWLALPPSSFTVNLNPDEPDRIIDAKFGKTDAGRVLLEADLQMKKTVGKLIHPDTSRGAKYWAALHGDTKCISMRQWIVPKPAVVRESDNELFIIDAPLEVKMETEYFKAKGVGGDAGCSKQSTSDTNYNEAIYRAQILPELEKAVNDAPDYADLRRVYASRVAAEWYRQRSKAKETAYSRIVDSGDVTAWPSRVNWTPKEVFDRYVKSYKDGEFRVEHKTVQGNYIYTNLYVFGGVDLTKIPKKLLSRDDLARDRPKLSATVGAALFAPTAEDGKNLTWLGGRSTERPLSEPTPPPTSPMRMPVFYVLAILPILAWLGFGVLLLRRRKVRA